MRLPEICIKHPVFAIVINLVLIVVGVLGYSKLETRFFPELHIPVASISTSYPGASQQLMENSVTNIIENAISDTEGVETITSKSKSGSSSISVKFKPGGNFSEEVGNLRDKVASVKTKLPVDAESPVVSTGGNASSVLSLSVLDKNPKVSPVKIRNYLERNVIPQLQSVPGVGGISTRGASDYAMRIWLKPQKMAALGVTVTDVTNAITNNNIDISAGSVQNPQRNFSVVSRTRLTTPEEFQNLIVKNDGNKVVRFKDIAKVELGTSSAQNSPLLINGVQGIDLEVKPLKSANPIQVAHLAKEKLKTIQKTLPAGLTVTVANDNSIFLKSSIDETFKAIGEAVLLVIIVVFLFLGSFRAAIIPIITIPLCIISGFGLILALGFSINTMTLLAMVLAIGLVVDDAIVMLENIHRYIEQRMEPFKAALKGSKEIAFAVIAMTITLAAVYAPIGFTSGVTSTIFKQFAFTLAGIVIISGFVALSLSPMMCSKLLRVEDNDNKFVAWLDKKFEKLSHWYQDILRTCLRLRKRIIVALLIIAGLGYVLMNSMQSEFVPPNDTGQILASIQFPPGASLSYSERQMAKLDKVYASIAEGKTYYSLINAGSANSQLTLKPWYQRSRTTKEVVNSLIPKFNAIPGITAFPYMPEIIDYGASTNSGLTVQLMTTGTYQDLNQAVQNVMAAMKAYVGLEYVNTSLKYNSQQYALTINRNKAANLGVNMSDISNTISVMLGGKHITDLYQGNKSYQVKVQVERSYLQDFKAINSLFVKTSATPTTTSGATSTSGMVPLSSLVNLKPIVGQPSLQHYNRMRSASITSMLAPGYTTGDVVKHMQQVLPSILAKTPNVSYAFDGKAKEMLESSGNVALTFVLAFIFIYLVLSAQFGSFIDPLVILLAVPLCIVGALLTLKLTGGTLNLYSQIGLVTLVGMISKHGILITQFTNDLREQGMPMTDAIVKAATIRLRPILMTTAAMVLGAVPLAFATGPGASGNTQIGWVIVGGLSFGTFFSLIVVPVAYSYLGKFKRFSSTPNVEPEA